MNEQLDLFPDTVCLWTVKDDSRYYTTACGREYVLTIAILKDNKAKYCCYCGKPLSATISDPDQ